MLLSKQGEQSIGHRAQLDDAKWLAVQARALLAEEDGGAEFDAHEQCQHGQQRAEQEEGWEGCHTIEKSFAATAVE